jgi:acyl carrier protein
MNIENRIVNVLRKRFEFQGELPTDVKLNSLFEFGLIDNLDLEVELENEFGVEFEISGLISHHTLKQLTNIVTWEIV